MAKQFPVSMQMGYMVKNFAPDADTDFDFYEGFIIIGKGEWWYRLTMMGNEKMANLGLKKGSLADDRQAFKIELEREKNVPFELTDREYMIFFSLLAPFHRDFVTANTTNVKNMSKYDYETMQKSCKKLGDICPIAMPSVAMIELSLEGLVILNSAKFNCQLR